jgi:D-alanyl-D-alanine dipeptidase
MWTYDGRRFVAPDFALGIAPAGNLYASVNDLCRFLQAIFDQGRLPDGQLLRPDTLSAMMTPQQDQNGRPQPFGIGFQVAELDGHRQIGHGGAVYGFSTQLAALPDKQLGVVAVASLDGSNGVVERMANYALRLMLASRAGAPLPNYERSEAVPPERAVLLEGQYESQGKRVELERNGQELMMRRGDYINRVRALGRQLVIDDVLDHGPTIVYESDGSLRIGDERFQRTGDPCPEAAPDKWQALIGEYGWDHNTLYILEDRGQLVALIEWFYHYPLTELSDNEFAFPDYGLYHGEKLLFRRDAQGRVEDVVAASVVFPRRAIGAEEGRTFRITPERPVEQLRAEAQASSPPAEAGQFREPELVELIGLDPTIKLDIRYASINNFMGAVVYPQPRAFMQRPAAEALVRAHQRLKQQGYGLLIHDAYRPWYVTKMFWDATPQNLKDFVANPALGSRHNRGCAVDLTLYDLQTGDVVPMVAGYDEFSARSFPHYPGGTSRQRWHRRLLRRAMEAEGFTVFEFEWWHFDYRDWKLYPILNSPLEKLP